MWHGIKALLGRRQDDEIEIQRAAFGPGWLREVAYALRTSPYLQQNILNQRFAATQGFSVVFQQEAPFLKHFPLLEPYLTRIADPQCNVSYLNALVLGHQGRVDRHVDHSIRGYDAKLPLPRQVWVLYVQVPLMTGGELLFYNEQDQITREIEPETGLLVRFPGTARHAIREMQQSNGETEARISLVCEQYALSSGQRQALPEFTIKSSAGFDAFLNQALTDSSPEP
jgi:hypothetical protein